MLSRCFPSNPCAALSTLPFEKQLFLPLRLSVL
jgi:hypothetical protein